MLISRQANRGSVHNKFAMRPPTPPRSSFEPPRGQSQQRGAPSVAFSELNMFANQSKLRAEDEAGSAGGDAESDYKVYNEDRVSTPEPEADYRSEAIADAAAEAGDVLQDQEFDFVQEEDEQINPTSRDSERLPPEVTGRGLEDMQYDSANMRRERVRLLAKLRRQQSRLPENARTRIDDAMSITRLREQAAGASYESRAKTAVLFLRRVTVAFAKMMELITQRFPRLGVELEGWSENVYLTLDQFDDMLYDIFDEYGDQVQANPIVAFVIALASNAAMFSMTKKMMSNPVANQVFGGLAGAVRQQQQRQAARRGNEPKSSGVGQQRSFLPSHGQPPAVLPTNQDVVGLDNNPMSALSNALGGLDLGELLGNLDLKSLLGGLGGASPASNVRPNHQTSGAVRSAHRVLNDDDEDDDVSADQGAMSGPSMAATGDIMRALRAQEDSSLPPIPDDEEEEEEEEEEEYEEDGDPVSNRSGDRVAFR
jgi:hypothetical protein